MCQVSATLLRTPSSCGLPLPHAPYLLLTHCSISALSFDQDTGFSTPLGLGDIPLRRQTFCLSDPPSYDFVGSWEQPCRTDVLSGFDIAVRWDIGDDGTYTITRLLFNLGSGCPLNGTSASLAIQIYEEGSVRAFELLRRISPRAVQDGRTHAGGQVR